jgi:hypothetical protein
LKEIFKIENLFNYIAIYSTALPLLLFVIFFKTVKSYKAAWLVVCFSILTIFNFVIVNHIPRTIIAVKIFYGVTTFYEYSLFTFFIWYSIINKKVKKGIIIISCLFFLFLILFYSKENLYRLDSFPIGVESILILIFSSYFFYEQINNPTIFFIYNDYKFWIITGIMIYLSGSFFIYIFSNQIPENELSLYWSFTYLFLSIMNIFFSIGILILGLQPNQKHHAKPKPNHHYLDIT